MKTNYLMVTLLATVILNTAKSQDLDFYTPFGFTPPGANGVITNVYFNIGNANSGNTSDFTVAAVLLNLSNQPVYWLDSIRISGIPAGTGHNVTGWNININNSNAVNGNYKLGIILDKNNEVSETDETNNSAAFSGTFSFTRNTVGIEQEGDTENNFKSTIYPNPMKEYASIKYKVKNNSDVKLILYNMEGKAIEILVSEVKSVGEYTVPLYKNNLAAGMYFYKLQIGNTIETNKIMVQ